MRTVVRRTVTGLGLAAVVAGCAGAEAESPRPEPWRQVYAVPGTSESQRELLVWDLTDPRRPVVHVFSFQDETFRSWKEIQLPTEPGTTWAKDQEPDAAPAK